MADSIGIYPGQSFSLYEMTIADSGGSHWGITVGGDKCGSDAETGYPGVAKATAFADVAGVGEVKRWAKTGKVVQVLDSTDDCLASISVDGNVRGQAFGIGGTGTVAAYLVGKNVDRGYKSSTRVAFHQATGFWTDFFDSSLEGSIDLNIYPGDTYEIEVRLVTSAFLAGGANLASGDAGPYDGDGGKLTLDSINIDYYDE